MLQRDRQIRTQAHQLADACIFGFSFWLACLLRSSAEMSELLGLEAIPPESLDQAPWIYFLLMLAPLVLESQGFYNRPPISSRAATFWPLFKGCIISAVGLVLLLYALKMSMPRGITFYFGIVSFALMWTKEELTRLAMRTGTARNQSKRRIIIAGNASEIEHIRQLITANPGENIEVAAEFNPSHAAPQQLIELLHEHSVSGVLVSAKRANFEYVENVIKVCETEGVEAWLVADFFAPQIARASFDAMFGHPVLVFRSTPDTSWQMVVKVLMDFFGALAAVLIFAVPMIFVALLVKLTSPGPVLFRQQRSGLNGAPFSIFKFRTMMTNAEQLQHELAAMNEMSGPVFKITNDPRLTPVGKFLRKTSLDELPQFFNVLRGEMSLVGPRPLPVNEVKRFNDLSHRRRLSVKPGVTCLWQISGRNKISDFKDWVRLDLEYIDNWSIWLDVKILLLTFPAVFKGTGAK